MAKLALYAAVLFSLALLIFSFVANESLCVAPTGYDCSVPIHVERLILIGIVAISSTVIVVKYRND